MTMVKVQTLESKVAAKASELDARLAEAGKIENKNTRQTKSYNIKWEHKVLSLVWTLLQGVGEDVALDDEDKATLDSILAPVGKAPAQVDFEEGDKLTDVLQKYSDVKNIMEKINKVCAAKSLAIDYSNGAIFVRVK